MSAVVDFSKNSKFYSLNKKIFPNEAIISFNKNNNNVQRNKNAYQIMDYKKRNYIALIIQRNVRGFFSRKAYNSKVQQIIVLQVLKSTIAIQSSYRRYSTMKKFNSNLIVRKICLIRKGCIEVIENYLNTYCAINQKKKAIIMQNIIQHRRNLITLIQRAYQTYHLRKVVKDIICYEKNKYVLTYPFYAKNVKLEIFFEKRSKIYQFEFCSIRKIYI